MFRKFGRCDNVGGSFSSLRCTNRVAARLPATRAEQTALGDASEALRDKVANAAGETFDKVKSAAMSAVDAAADQIAESDLGARAG